MMKHSVTLLIAAATMALAGCELYFGNDQSSNDSWNYCGSDGYYECSGDTCYWRGPQCPAGTGSGTGSGSSQPGYECTTSNDCAAGCYCQNGSCEEAGFCTTDDDCGTGYHCNTQRSSCEPDGTTPPTKCTDDAGCPAGEVCDPSSLTCQATCTCTTDKDATDGGYDYCDEDRGTCMSGADPIGVCAGTVAPTCNVAKPKCGQGSVPLLVDGCYTGVCQQATACGTKPACTSYQFDADCRADNTCSSAYYGTNCHKPDNSACMAGDTNCTCTNYAFLSCQDAGSPRLVEYDGHMWDASALTLRN